MMTMHTTETNANGDHSQQLRVSFTSPTAERRCAAIRQESRGGVPKSSQQGRSQAETELLAYHSRLQPEMTQRQNKFHRSDLNIGEQLANAARAQEAIRQGAVARFESEISAAKESGGNELHHMLLLIQVAVLHQWAERSTHLVDCLKQTAPSKFDAPAPV